MSMLAYISIITIDMSVTISAHEARKHLGELLNQAYYQGKPFILTCGNKAMATLIGTQEFRLILAVLEKHDPALADSLAIMSNPEVQELLSAGEADVKAGTLLSVEDVMNDA
jgi:PHD/YefM family antitoxin component YafN of YafNO toxin-antitoxin module